MSTNEQHYPHTSVLADEVVESFAPLFVDPSRKLLLLDGTLGAGGHAARLLALSTEVSLIGIDRDDTALELASQRLSAFAPRFKPVKGNFSDAEELTAAYRSRGGTFNGILLDLGVSSMQIDTPERGFSFKFDGPLDMRMDPTQGLSAATVVNEYGEGDLRRVFLRGGVKPDYSKALARNIVRKRPLHTTRELVATCKRTYETLPGAKGGTRSKNPATTPFQALRIEVNDELNSIRMFLDSVPKLLAPNGILSIISFHSSEDRLVAGKMREWGRQQILSQFNPELSLPGLGKLLTPKAIIPSPDEQAANPRSRSALLRVFQRGETQ
jgi:16S rRNA (cytosine1402-N4)-methyltransferase